MDLISQLLLGNIVSLFSDSGYNDLSLGQEIFNLSDQGFSHLDFTN